MRLARLIAGFLILPLVLGFGAARPAAAAEAAGVPAPGSGFRLERSELGGQEGPAAVSVFDGVAYLLDAEEHRIVAFGAIAGKKMDVIRYPDRYAATDMAFDGKHFHLLDISRQRYAVLDARGNVVSDSPAPADAALRQVGTDVRLAERTAGTQPLPVHGGLMTMSRTDGFGAISVSVDGGASFAIESRYLLGGADLLGSKADGYYLVVEELLDSHEVTAERSVRWYGPDGQLRGIYEVPFWEYAAYPTRDVAFDPVSGAVYNLIVRDEEIEVRTVTWTDPGAYTGRLARLSRQGEAPEGRPATEGASAAPPGPEALAGPALQNRSGRELPGDLSRLAATLAAEGPVRYRILVVASAEGEDLTGYLDRVVAQWGPPEPDMLYLLIFAEQNYNIRFYMGADFRTSGVDVDEMINLVYANYLLGKRDGDVAGALARLIGAVNRRMAGECLVYTPYYSPGLRRSAALDAQTVDALLRCYFAGQEAEAFPDDQRPLDARWDPGLVRAIGELQADPADGPDAGARLLFEVPFDVLPAAGADSVWAKQGGEPGADRWITGLRWRLTVAQEGKFWRLERFGPYQQDGTVGR